MKCKICGRSGDGKAVKTNETFDYVHHLCKNIYFDDIRRICLQHSNNPEIAFNILSNLSWYRYKQQIKNLAKLIPRNAVVLEVGVGYGFCSSMLRELCPDIEITAIDIHHHECWSKLKNYTIKFQVGNGESLEFQDNTFDAIMSFGVIEHLDTRKFLLETNRVLKNDGLLFIFNLPNKFSITEYIARKINIYYHPQRYDTKAIKDLIESNGFKIISTKNKFIIPSQINMLGDRIGNFSNLTYKFLDKLDNLLMKLPIVNFFSQSIEIYAKKQRQKF